MVKFTNLEFIKYFLGDESIYSHIDALHATGPNGDLYTGDIVQTLSKKIKVSSIISRYSRNKYDLNRSRSKHNYLAIDEYRNTINLILSHLNIINEIGQLKKPYLHIALHGMKNRPDMDIELGTLYGSTCDKEVSDWVKTLLENNLGCTVADNMNFIGDRSKSVHRLGDGKFSRGYGMNFNTIQIEVSRKLREYQRDRITAALAEIITSFGLIFK